MGTVWLVTSCRPKEIGHGWQDHILESCNGGVQDPAKRRDRFNEQVYGRLRPVAKGAAKHQEYIVECCDQGVKEVERWLLCQGEQVGSRLRVEPEALIETRDVSLSIYLLTSRFIDKLLKR